MISGMNNKRQEGRPRVDWRFLLPSSNGIFRHMVLLGGPADLPARIIEHGIAQRVSRKLSVNGSADAVVVLSDARASLEDVAGCLLPGGTLYYEVDRRLPMFLAATPGRLQDWLKSVGLSPTGIYWAAPDFVHCKRYIPLDLPETIQWYLSTLYVAGTPLHRLIEFGIRLYQGDRSPLFASIAPCYAVTAIAGAKENASPSVLGHPAFPLHLKRSGLRPVVLTSGQDEGSRAIILPFAPGSGQPIAVFKVSTLPNFNKNTEHEQTILTEIRSRLDGSMCRTIPQPLGLFHYGNSTVGIESCAAGHPILVSSGRWRASFQEQVDDLQLASNWLIEFHRQAQIGRLPWNDVAFDRWIDTPIRNYAQTFGLTTSEKNLFACVRRYAKALEGASLPIVWMHYDYGPWNLYRAAGKFTVIDWEFGRNWERDRFGPALYDLLYFVTYWIHLVQHLNNQAAELRGFYKLFIEPKPKNKYSKVVYQVIRDYLEALDIDRRFLPLLLVYMWIEQALHQFARKRDLSGVQADARIDNRCVKYIGVLAEYSEPFFAQISCL